MVSMCVQIETTRSIAAQILSHRSFSFKNSLNVMQVRCSINPPHLRSQDPKNRQNSIDDIHPHGVQHFSTTGATGV